MPRMLAIGSEAFTLPFGALGFQRVPALHGEFIETLRTVLAGRDVALVVCGESFVAGPAMAEFEEATAGTHATVIIVPDGPAPLGIGRELLRRAIEHAAGVDLLGTQ